MKPAFTLLALCLASGPVFGQALSPAPKEPALDPAKAADARAIADVVIAFTKAFEAADAKGVAMLFTDDAQVSDESGTTKGRANIEARFASYFAQMPKPKLTIKVDGLRFVSPDVAIEDGRADVKSDTPGGKAESSKYTVVYVRQDGKWLHSSLRDMPADELPAAERLKELDWLVGDWVNESHEAVVHSTCKWSDDRHYLLRDFVIQVQGKPALKVNQRIGWDPAAKQVRSWVFDSEGGFADGFWTRNGDQWMIKVNGVRSDGKLATATQIIAHLGRDHLRWASYDRTTGGELVPNVDEFTMVRKPPEPSAIPARPR
jgi:uncharacterized protein (TIGR02246 family)